MPPRPASRRSASPTPSALSSAPLLEGSMCEAGEAPKVLRRATPGCECRPLSALDHDHSCLRSQMVRRWRGRAALNGEFTPGALGLGNSLGVGLGIHRSRTCMRSLLERANAQRIDGPTKASRIRLKSKPRKISCSGRQLARGTLSCLCPDRQRSSVISHVRILLRDYARFAAKLCRKMVSCTDVCELLHRPQVRR